MSNAFLYMFMCNANFSEELEGEGNDMSEKEEEINWDEIKEQRADEITALDSIYGDSFNELITNRVWIIKLELEYLSALLDKQAHGEYSSKIRIPFQSHKKDTKNEKICEFYQKGSCRFGNKCNFKHVLLRDVNKSEPYYKQPEKELENDGNKSPYKVEIRFPEGNKYPLEAPFVAFTCSDNRLPEHTCLNLSGRMIKEAKELTADGLPAVFSMISVLDDRDTVEEILRLRPQRYSLPEPVISAQQAEEDLQRQLQFTKQFHHDHYLVNALGDTFRFVPGLYRNMHIVCYHTCISCIFRIQRKRT